MSAARCKLNFYVPLNHHKKFSPLNLTPSIQPNSHAYILKINQGKMVRKSTFFLQHFRVDTPLLYALVQRQLLQRKQPP